MSFVTYENKKVVPAQTRDSIAEIELVKEQKFIDLKEGEYAPQGIIKRANLSMPFCFMTISLVIWWFSIVGLFVSFLLKLA